MSRWKKRAWGQGVVGQGGQRCHLDRCPRRLKSLVQALLPRVAPVAVVVGVHQGKHGPAVGVAGGLLNGPFQTGQYFREVLGSEAFVVAEAA